MTDTQYEKWKDHNYDAINDKRRFKAVLFEVALYGVQHTKIFLIPDVQA